MSSNNYLLIKAPSYYIGPKLRRGFCYLHVFVFVTKTGRSPASGEIIHHKDKNTWNNTIDNLECLSRAAHASHHHSEQLGREANRSILLDNDIVYLLRALDHLPPDLRGYVGYDTSSIKYCEQCACELLRNGNRFCSDRCFKLFSRKVVRPSHVELLDQINAGVSWSALGRKYGVSDNAVRKWVRSFVA